MTTLEIILFILLFLGAFELYSLFSKSKDEIERLKEEIEELRDNKQIEDDDL